MLQEFDFKITYKFRWVHSVLDHLYNNENGEPIVGVEYQLPNIVLYIQYKLISTHLSKIILEIYFENEMPKKKKGKIVVKFKPYTFYEGKLYKLGLNAILK